MEEDDLSLAEVENFLAVMAFPKNGKVEFETFQDEWSFRQYRDECVKFGVEHTIVYVSNTIPF